MTGGESICRKVEISGKIYRRNKKRQSATISGDWKRKLDEEDR